MEFLSEAILHLRPTAQFSYNDNDYSTVKWDVLEGDAPTLAEIKATIEQIKTNQITAEAKKATAKESATAKLAALGLTTDDLKALGL